METQTTTTQPAVVAIPTIDCNQRKAQYPLAQMIGGLPKQMTFVNAVQAEVGHQIIFGDHLYKITSIHEERPAKGSHPEGILFYDVNVEFIGPAANLLLQK